MNILWRHFLVYKSIDHRKLPSRFVVVVVVVVYKGAVTSDVIFICCTLLDEPVSARKLTVIAIYTLVNVHGGKPPLDQRCVRR